VVDEATAIRTLRQLHIDVLILDLQLKVGTGFGVLEAIGANRPVTIVMTNYALPQYRERARQLGVDYFLNKENDFERLPEIVSGLRAAAS
jgi:CheY-like chemotaxis protein